MPPKNKKAADKKGRTESSATNVEDESKEKSICGSCGQEVKDDDGVEALQCDMCNMWHHIECETVSKEEFDFLHKKANSNACIFWYCRKCAACAGKIMTGIANLERKHEELAKSVDTINKTVVKMEKDLETKCDETQVKKTIQEQMEKAQIKQQLEEKCGVQQVKEIVEEQLERKSIREETDWRPEKQEVQEIIRKELEDAQQTTQKAEGNSLPDAVDEAMKEVNERKVREKNAVILRVPEANTNVKEERIKSDKEFFHRLAETCGVHLNTQDVQVNRLGQRKEGYNRPIIVKFQSLPHKTEFFKGLKNLKGREDFKEIQVFHDMTPREREEWKKLREEAK